MRNPWQDLPVTAPFVLPEDKPFVDAFNEICKRSGDSNHELHFELPPSPFTGFHDAPLVVLLANPLWVESSIHEQTQPEFFNQLLDGITAVNGTAFWPILDDVATTQAGKWWRPKIENLKEIVGTQTYNELAQKILAIDLHGYHSSKWSAPYVNFPSQAFTFQLVREIVQRGEATIIVARCWRQWYAAIPELISYEPQVARLNSSQSAFLSRNNMSELDFQKVERALTSR